MTRNITVAGKLISETDKIPCKHYGLQGILSFIQFQEML
ncbi:hypothetical protein M091_0327 [Parabacteroides distasonis str. 3776 D15 i]|uniref:Single-stranded DNA-binding protein n=1 Tax=Parabacteroides distasonis str. 3776 D15 i TaxID=1339342 RepID=A0AB34L7N1_PARDI|nr:hypothetical protein M091_0327 [Parabacteroides distasonis str. 3776 D15 i]